VRYGHIWVILAGVLWESFFTQETIWRNLWEYVNANSMGDGMMQANKE